MTEALSSVTLVTRGKAQLRLPAPFSFSWPLCHLTTSLLPQCQLGCCKWGLLGTCSSEGRSPGNLGGQGRALRHSALLGCWISTGSLEVWGALICSFQIQCPGWWVLCCHVPIPKLWHKPQFWLQCPGDTMCLSGHIHVLHHCVCWLRGWAAAFLGDFGCSWQEHIT